MPFEPLRFVHAANLFLDSPLGLPPGFDSLDDSLKCEIEDATLTAFASLIDVCLERDVDFLLLGGNTFVETDYSLPARIALRNGWNRLDEAGIRLYVLPGVFDPPDAWTRIPEMPDGVTVLNHSDTEPLAILRNGTLIAALAMADPAEQQDDERQRESSGPFRIGLCPLDADGRPASPGAILPSHVSSEFSPFQQAARPNTARLAQLVESNRLGYLAVAGVANRLLLRSDSGLIHHPGPTQSLLAVNGENGGCTLVDANARDDIRCTTLPTAAVRFQTIKLTVEEDADRDGVISAISAQLDTIKPQPRERVRIIEWKLGNRGSEDDIDELLGELPARLETEPGIALVHHLAAPPDSPATTPTESHNDSDELTDEFRRELHEFVEAGGFDPHEAISGTNGLDVTAADRLHAFAEDFATSSLTAIAEQTGAERLRTAVET